MTDLVPHARAWAIEKHGTQTYGKGESARPYAYHLGTVAEIAAPYGETAQVVAWLHDVIEDTSTSEADVRAEFGDRIARLVKFLTDEPGEDRPARKVKTNAKLAAVTGDDTLALVVKAADRLANLRESSKPGSEKQLAKYRGEHPEIRKAVYRPGLCDPLWKELDGLVGTAANG
jgi:(p)ppGpp synthase/HD superfamily hydrolase